MNGSFDPSWPLVSADELCYVLSTLDYSRYGWSNVIEYLEKPSGKIFAYELNNGEHHLHPSLYTENEFKFRKNRMN